MLNLQLLVLNNVENASDALLLGLAEEGLGLVSTHWTDLKEAVYRVWK